MVLYLGIFFYITYYLIKKFYLCIYIVSLLSCARF